MKHPGSGIYDASKLAVICYNFLLSSDLHHDESFKMISILLVQVGRSTTQRLAIFNFCKLTDTKTSWSKTKADLPKAGESQENHDDAFVRKMNTRVAWNGETGFRRSSWTCDSSNSSCSIGFNDSAFPSSKDQWWSMAINRTILEIRIRPFFSIRSYHFPGFFLYNHVIQTKAQQKATDTSGRGMDPSRDSQAGFIPVQFSASSSSNSRTKDSSWYENHHKWSLSLFHLDEQEFN